MKNTNKISTPMEISNLDHEQYLALGNFIKENPKLTPGLMQAINMLKKIIANKDQNAWKQFVVSLEKYINDNH